MFIFINYLVFKFIFLQKSAKYCNIALTATKIVAWL